MQAHILNLSQQSILKAVLYFDVFMYPLKYQELYEYTSVKLTTDEFTNELNSLVSNNLIAYKNGFYFNPTSPESIIKRRIEANALADKMLPIASHYSKKIARFPFMKCICISGGLSKNYYDDKSDIDYFVITKANRLWICRTLFILFYKTLPLSKRKYYCLNYFISEADLNVPDQNAFVAAELASLIPTVHLSLYQNLIETNNWHTSFFPNKTTAVNTNCAAAHESFLKKATETFFSGKLGNSIDSFLLKITLKHWRKKYPEMSNQDFDIQYRSRKHVCKRHSHGSQNKVLNLWNDKISSFENNHTVILK